MENKNVTIKPSYSISYHILNYINFNNPEQMNHLKHNDKICMSYFPYSNDKMVIISSSQRKLLNISLYMYFFQISLFHF